jgi:hypothetical protein
MILTTAPDVLLVIVAMFAAGTAASHLLFRKSLWRGRSRGLAF